MTGVLSTSIEVDRIYHEQVDDPPFTSILATAAPQTDSELAELIEADGRSRIRRGRVVDLGRYLEAIPDLAGRVDPLDAAIDMSLRWLARTGQPDDAAVDALSSQYPQFQKAIRETAALSNAVWSTQRLRRSVADGSLVPDLPHPFGPISSDGGRRYELKELLGDGAFGEVYLAVDRELSDEDRPALVAIKGLSRGKHDPWERQRSIEEATKARRIEHPAVVRVFDRGFTENDDDFIVYEYVDGGDLARWARRRERPIPARDAAGLVARIARGVHAAHMAGLVHCDLKPHNIMMTSHGEPKVADFGIAVRLDQSSLADRSELPSLRPGEGNLAFISPEQYRREPGALTAPSDIYALGGILYWLLTDELPNGATPEDVERTHSADHGRKEAPSPGARRADIDCDLDAICTRAMDPRPHRRHNSAAALADDLEAWLRNESIPWTQPSPARRLRLWIRRKPGLAASFLILSIIVISSLATAQALSHRTAIARAEAAARKEAQDGALQKIDDFTAAKAAADDFPSIVLPYLWIMEWLSAPGFLDDPKRAAVAWERRVEIVNRLIDHGRQQGGDLALDTLLWETALAHMQITTGEYAKAAPLAADLCERWREVLEPDDPWLDKIDFIELVARTNRLIDQAETDEEFRLSELEPIAEELEQALIRFRPMHECPQHRLAILRLQTIYGEPLLDNPQRRAELQEEWDRL